MKFTRWILRCSTTASCYIMIMPVIKSIVFSFSTNRIIVNDSMIQRKRLFCIYFKSFQHFLIFLWMIMNNIDNEDYFYFNRCHLYANKTSVRCSFIRYFTLMKMLSFSRISIIEITIPTQIRMAMTVSFTSVFYWLTI